MNRSTCATCRWWDNGRQVSVGDCHGAPPAVTDPGALLGVFPLTRSTDWCGAHRPREDLLGGVDARETKAEGRLDI